MRYEYMLDNYMIYLLAMRVNITIASFFLPTVMSQRGDSGKIQKYMITNTQGTDVTSCKYLQSLTKYAITAIENKPDIYDKSCKPVACGLKDFPLNSITVM